VTAHTGTDPGRSCLRSRRELSAGECVTYLAGGAIGRVIYLDSGWPEVIPVSYRVADEAVVFGVETSSPLARRSPGSVVIFQADCFDPDHESGWHVRAIGVIGSFLRPEELAVAGSILPPPWPVGGRTVELVIQIRFTAMNGHVIEVDEAAP